MMEKTVANKIAVEYKVYQVDAQCRKCAEPLEHCTYYLTPLEFCEQQDFSFRKRVWILLSTDFMDKEMLKTFICDLIERAIENIWPIICPKKDLFQALESIRKIDFDGTDDGLQNPVAHSLKEACDVAWNTSQYLSATNKHWVSIQIADLIFHGFEAFCAYRNGEYTIEQIARIVAIESAEVLAAEHDSRYDIREQAEFEWQLERIRFYLFHQRHGDKDK